jgi:ABC-type transport system involved in cytochrome bd biosynthesis fused ATPase/permease subunit
MNQLLNILKKLKPDIIVKGKEHELLFYTVSVYFEKSIKPENLIFKYNLDVAIVSNDLNIMLEKGKRYGFVYAAGCGQSIFLDVIMGLLIPIKGRLIIDDNVKDNYNSWLLLVIFSYGL